MNSKLLIFLLLLSLGVNLALAGFLVGRGESARGAHFAMGMTHLNPRMLWHMTEDRRDSMRPAVRKYFKAIHAEARGTRRARRQLTKAIRAQPFDPKAASEALSAMDEQLGQLRKAGHQSFIDFLQQLTPEERLLISNPPARKHRPRDLRRPHHHPEDEDQQPAPVQP